MRRIAITGASGLVGGNLAALAVARGLEVVCTRRPASRIQHLAALPIRWVEAELSDPAALAAAFAGADAVFHCAAQVSIQQRISREVYLANVIGTERVIDAAVAAGVGRLVHCSTVAASAISDDGTPVSEDRPYNFAAHGLADAYSRTKRASQERVLAAARTRLDAVVVQPGLMFGPLDARPSSGALIVNVARGRAVVHSPGTNSVVDVRDVVDGMLAGAARGRRGEIYILGGHNLTYAELLSRIAAVAGVRPPRLAIPRPLAELVGRAGDLYQATTGREAKLNSITVRYGYCDGYQYSSAKAERELGYRIGPLEPAIRDALAWLRAHAMI